MNTASCMSWPVESRTTETNAAVAHPALRATRQRSRFGAPGPRPALNTTRANTAWAVGAAAAAAGCGVVHWGAGPGPTHRARTLRHTGRRSPTGTLPPSAPAPHRPVSRRSSGCGSSLGALPPSVHRRGPGRNRTSAAPAPHHNIGGFNIAMQDALAVGISQSIQQLQGHGLQLLPGPPLRSLQ